MKVRFQEWDFGGKLIFISIILGILSLFMSWVDIGIIRVSGFQQQGYVLLILFIYPIYKLLKGTKINKVLGLICSIIAVICGFAFLRSKSVEFLGSMINAGGAGIYLFIIASIMLTVGIIQYKYQPDQPENNGENREHKKKATS
jgi:cytochrome b subunit of formate dehydrogenase